MRFEAATSLFKKVLLSVLCLSLMVAGRASALDRQTGDVDNSGQVDIGDAILDLRQIVGLDQIPAADLRYTDVSPHNADDTFGDGSVKIGDVVSLLRRIVGLEDIALWPGRRYFQFPDPPAIDKVRILMPKESMYVGSYAYVPVEIESNTGLTVDDLDFTVDGGLKGGMVSPSKDPSFDPKKPTIMFGAGYKPGDYKITAVKKGTTDVLAESPFGVTDIYKDNLAGPSLWFDGAAGGYQVGSAWGGGPTGPQNINVVPHSGSWRVGVVFVDTSDQRYTTDAATLQTFRDRWQNEVHDGIMDGGKTRSSDLFYREVSYNNLNLSVTVFPDVVHLPDDFDTYYNSDGWPTGSMRQSAITAADDAVNYNDFDVIVFVSQDVASPAKFAWPVSTIGKWGPYSTAEGDINLAVISMPNAWETLDGRKIYETLSHELGHSLGLGDQYTPSVPGRNPGNWEMMHGDGAFPHFSIAHRMWEGWVTPTMIRNFNFSSGLPVDETVTLNPVENGLPPAGRFAGIEVRLADGWNYYLEYRKGQVSQIADQSLPTDSSVLGTDVVSSPFTPPIERPTILLLRNDEDGDGSVLTNGLDYKETDTTSPTYPTDFKVSVSGINGSKADVRIQYGVNSKPDPSIRPWPASPSRQWQSPDIEVQNARNLADPANWFNVPWEGNPNDVIATVKNNGNLAAPGVKVDFYVKDFTVSGAPETYLGSDTQDLPAAGTVQFHTNWVPPSSTGHYCIVVRMPIYFVPGTNPPVLEMSATNNEAQSNYTKFISRSASPPTRETTEVMISNPFDKPTYVFINPGQSNQTYRSYVEHTWLFLQPKEQRKVRLMFEFMGDDYNKIGPERGDKQPQATLRKLRLVTNRVGFRANYANPNDSPLHSIDTLGGVDVDVAQGVKTEFSRFVAADVGQATRVFGNVVLASDHKTPAPNGKVLVTFTYKGRDETHPIYKYVLMDCPDGSFGETVKESGWLTAKAYYLPPPGAGDCESEVITHP